MNKNRNNIPTPTEFSKNRTKGKCIATKDCIKQSKQKPERSQTTYLCTSGNQKTENKSRICRKRIEYK